jgi:hypothetical protein
MISTEGSAGEQTVLQRNRGESKDPCLAFVCVWLRLAVVIAGVTVHHWLCSFVFVFCRCYICCYTSEGF